MSAQVNLPFPWEMKWSKTKSRFYFYNPETKDSQWKIPKKTQPTAKNAGETAKTSNVPTTKKSAIIPLPQSKSPIDSGKTKSLHNAPKVKRPKCKRLNRDEDTAKFATRFEPSIEQKESFFPRVLRVAESSKPGKMLPGKSPNSPMVGGKPEQNGKAPPGKLNDENSGLDSKLSFGFLKSSRRHRRRGSRVEKLEDGSESKCGEVQWDRLLAQGKTEKNDEEEEEMEVEYSPEVQIIFQEIQGVREQMKNMETEEVTSEVQMIVDNITSAPQCHSQKLWFVLDTNLFLEDIRLLRDLKDQLTRQFDNGFVFVIPWIVIQEIDRIKDNHRSLSRKLDLGARARVAVNVIHKWLETKDPNIVGQNPRDAATKYQVKDGFTIENNDDKILHCCLQFQDIYSSGQVALLTLDKNLRNKGMVMGINTFSKETLNKWLKNATPTRASNSVNKTPRLTSMNSPFASENPWFTPQTNSNSKSFARTPVSSESPTAPISKPGLVLSASSAYQFSSYQNNEWSASNFSTTPRRVSPPRGRKSLASGVGMSLPGVEGLSSVPSSDVSAFEGDEPNNGLANFLNLQMSSIERIMLDGLAALLERSMRDAYKDLWEDILVVKKPWSIIEVLHAINKHWIAIFKSFWSREDQLLVKNLCLTFQNRPDSFSELSTVLGLCRQLWGSFDPKRWEVGSSQAEFEAMKKQSLIQLSELEKSLKHSRESETCKSSTQLDGTLSFRSSVEMDSSIVPSSTANVPAAATSGFLLAPPNPVEAMFSEEAHQLVCDCFDAILKHFISLRDLIREGLSSSSSLDCRNRPLVLQSFIQLGQYVCAVHDQYERALLEKKNVNEQSIYLNLLSTLSSFAQQFSIQVCPITCQALQRFFRDETKRAVVEVGLSQIQSIRSSIIDCQQLLTPTESYHLFNT